MRPTRRQHSSARWVLNGWLAAPCRARQLSPRQRRRLYDVINGRTAQSAMVRPGAVCDKRSAPTAARGGGGAAASQPQPCSVSKFTCTARVPIPHKRSKECTHLGLWPTFPALHLTPHSRNSGDGKHGSKVWSEGPVPLMEKRSSGATRAHKAQMGMAPAAPLP